MKKHKLIQCLTLILIAAAARADDPEPRYQNAPHRNHGDARASRGI